MSSLKIFFTIILISYICSYDYTKDGVLKTWYAKDQDIYKGRYFPDGCNTTVCPEPNYCQEGACLCDDKYANYPFTGYNGVYCTYKRKRQVVAFLWELFTNVGVGHYYIHEIARGFFKTLMMVIPLTIFILGKLKLLKWKFNEGTTGIVMCSLLCATGVGAFVWWLVDAILFGLNKYRDFNGVPLKHW